MTVGRVRVLGEYRSDKLLEYSVVFHEEGIRMRTHNTTDNSRGGVVTQIQGRIQSDNAIVA
jgi:hypothetical protein